MELPNTVQEKHPMRRRLAGGAVTLAVDVAIWVMLILGAASRYFPIATFAAAMTGGFLVVGVLFGLSARKRGDRAFLQGVIIATSVMLLLEATCWGLAASIIKTH